MILLVNQLMRFPHRLVGLVATTPSMTSSRRTAMPRHFCFPSRCLEWRTKPRDSRLRVSISCNTCLWRKNLFRNSFFAVFVWFLLIECVLARDTNSTSNDQLTKSHVQGTVPEITNQHSQHALISQITEIIDQNQETTSSWRRTPRNLGATWFFRGPVWNVLEKKIFESSLLPKYHEGCLVTKLSTVLWLAIRTRNLPNLRFWMRHWIARNANQRNSVAVSISNRPIRMWCHSRSTGPFDAILNNMFSMFKNQKEKCRPNCGYWVKKNHGQWVKTGFSHFWLIFIPCYMWFFAFHWPYNQHSDGIFTPAWQFSSSFHTLPVGQVPVHLPGRFQHWTPRDSPNSNRENAGKKPFQKRGPLNNRRPINTPYGIWVPIPF